MFDISFAFKFTKTSNLALREGLNFKTFNPPYSKHVQTKIGEKFLKLVDKHFPPGHPLVKIVNRNTVKVSYKCMPNMKQAIGRHNSQVLKDQQGDETHQPGCNCTGRCCPCPLQGGCLVDNVVYNSRPRFKS